MYISTKHWRILIDVMHLKW